jgi:uncharacterized protein YcbK (DUF882 family)
VAAVQIKKKKMKLKNFRLSEFDSPDAPGSGVHMDTSFLMRLDEARTRAGVCFVISSGYRTKEHNERLIKWGVKVSKNSSHLKGLAAHILCEDPTVRLTILKALMQMKFTRIGIHSRFIHVDADTEKADAIWIY